MRTARAETITPIPFRFPRRWHSCSLTPTSKPRNECDEALQQRTISTTPISSPVASTEWREAHRLALPTQQDMVTGKNTPLQGVQSKVFFRNATRVCRNSRNMHCSRHARLHLSLPLLEEPSLTLHAPFIARSAVPSRASNWVRRVEM
jgi:hypothetical protein